MLTYEEPSPQPMLHIESATGEIIPDTPTWRVRTSVPRPPVRFCVLRYGEYTEQLYDGSDRAKADSVWTDVERGIFLGVNSEHVWAAIDRK